jgi:hypothetical protein
MELFALMTGISNWSLAEAQSPANASAKSAWTMSPDGKQTATVGLGAMGRVCQRNAKIRP